MYGILIHLLTGINRQGDLFGAAQSGFGDISSGHCEEGVPTEAALLATLAAFAVSFGILYMASTTNMARRKRNNDINVGDILQDVMWKGKEILYSKTQ